MNISGNTILITGGASGIGLALTEAFIQQRNTVLICGRRQDRLEEVQKRFSGVEIRRCDVGDPAQRKALFEWAVDHFPHLNMLVNNAGIQKMVDFKQGAAALEDGEDEVAINLSAPVHLSALFIPHLMQQPVAAIVNISSGLGFIPLAAVPVYCATKAALHTFSWSLRHQLRDTRVKVFEIIPPTVDTELDRGRRDRSGFHRGIPPEPVADATLRALQNDQYEGPLGEAANLYRAARENPEQVFQGMNAPRR